MANVVSQPILLKLRNKTKKPKHIRMFSTLRTPKSLRRKAEKPLTEKPIQSGKYRVFNWFANQEGSNATPVTRAL